MTRKRGEVEVEAVGCVSGTTLTETNLNRNPSNGAENPNRRWRLRLSKAQEAALKELGAVQCGSSGWRTSARLPTPQSPRAPGWAAAAPTSVSALPGDRRPPA
ncbi:MAG: hypothetical protein R2712_07140 [Vicinamibacterales bacterium]